MKKLYRYVMLIYSLFLTSHYLFADEIDNIKQNNKSGKLRNPFIAYYEVVQKQVQIQPIVQKPQIEVSFKLTGVLQGKQTLAIINDDIVKVGDIIDGFTIKQIGKDFVTVERAGKQRTIQLYIQEENEQEEIE